MYPAELVGFVGRGSVEGASEMAQGMAVVVMLVGQPTDGCGSFCLVSRDSLCSGTVMFSELTVCAGTDYWHTLSTCSESALVLWTGEQA